MLEVVAVANVEAPHYTRRETTTSNTKLDTSKLQSSKRSKIQEDIDLDFLSSSFIFFSFCFVFDWLMRTCGIRREGERRYEGVTGGGDLSAVPIWNGRAF
jgi:hypothetical protein